MEKIIIKKVAPQDADFLFMLMNNPAILKKLNEIPTQKQDWIDAVLAWEDDPDECGYIVWNNEKQIGWFAFNSLKSDDRVPYLKMAVLLPEYQSRGIGVSVLSELLTSMKDAGYNTVKLHTDEDNISAQKCYRKCGFQVVDTISETMSDNSTVMRYVMECKL